MDGTSVGVDIGGTFTDIVAGRVDRVVVDKVPSTPQDPAIAVVDGVPRDVARIGGVLDEFRHGTTVATNAILEGTGARTAFVVTAGFEDLLDLARQNRVGLYDLTPAQPVSLIPSDLCFPVAERLTASGDVLLPLASSEAETVAQRVRDSGAEAAAVCLLFSYLNPSHELLLGRALEAAGIPASLSHQVMPARGEYERACATVFNASVSSLMARYLQRMNAALAPRSFWVMSSCGTAMALDEVVQRGVETALSGPAAGVAGAAAVAGRVGMDRIVTFDMGGTSTDVALVEGGRPTLTRDGTIGERPLGVEAVDIHTIGAGGGSLARLDEALVLRVGPQSAGAQPGPACYGRGGTVPTVTDANVVLGRLRTDWFLDGRMALDEAASRRVVEPLARAMGVPLEQAALGIVRVAESNMERALRRISLERGHDPRRFTLVAFGGAGPLHGCAMARALAMPAVLVPPDPGALCALGALTADEVTVTRRALALDAGPGGAEPPVVDVEAVFAELVPVADEGWTVERSVELRYRGQSSGMQLPWSAAEGLSSLFRTEHRRRYGFDHGEAPTELTAAIVRRRRRARPCPVEPVPEAGPVEPMFTADAVFAAGPLATRFFRRRTLGRGAVVEGPAVIGEHTSTVLIEPGFAGRVLDDGSRLLERTGVVPCTPSSWPSSAICSRRSAKRWARPSAAAPSRPTSRIGATTRALSSTSEGAWWGRPATSRCIWAPWPMPWPTWWPSTNSLPATC